MTFKNSNHQEEENKYSVESQFNKNWRNLIIFILKRILHYLTVLHGAITLLVLILFIPTLGLQESIDFYLDFTFVIFISYAILQFIVHLLQKSYLKSVTEESKDELKKETKIKPEIAIELLQGKTFQVYWYIFTHDHAGIREIQKALNFSSSGTVAYQITKLLNAEVISRDEIDGKYSINKEIKIGVLKFFIRVGNRMIPRLSLYLIMYLSGFIIYLILALIQGEKFMVNPISLFFLFFLIVGTIIFIFESYRIWKLNPTK